MWQLRRSCGTAAASRRHQNGTVPHLVALQHSTHLADVVQQPGLALVDGDRGGGVPRQHVHKAFGDAEPLNFFPNLWASGTQGRPAGSQTLSMERLERAERAHAARRAVTPVGGWRASEVDGEGRERWRLAGRSRAHLRCDVHNVNARLGFQLQLGVMKASRAALHDGLLRGSRRACRSSPDGAGRGRGCGRRGAGRRWPANVGCAKGSLCRGAGGCRARRHGSGRAAEALQASDKLSARLGEPIRVPHCTPSGHHPVLPARVAPALRRALDVAMQCMSLQGDKGAEAQCLMKN